MALRMTESREPSETERAPRATSPKRQIQRPQPPNLTCERGSNPESDSVDDSSSVVSSLIRDASTDRSMAISSLWSVLAEVGEYWQSVRFPVLALSVQFQAAVERLMLSLIKEPKLGEFESQQS